jgi:4-carboxymuconolactone decarboxylase
VPLGDLEHRDLEDVLDKIPRLANGEIANIFRVLAQHPRLLRRYNVLGGLFLSNGLLDARLRELVILRVGWLTQSEYEFGQHVLIGRRHGISEDVIGRIRGGDLEGLSESEEVAIGVTDELLSTDTLSDTAWVRIRGLGWSDPEILELLMLVGFYWMTASMLRACRVPLEEGVIGWPVGDHKDANR